MASHCILIASGLPASSGPLLWILESLQEALPPELRAVYEPLAQKLANVLRSDALVPTMRRLLALLGSSLSHLATEVMLKPRGRIRLEREPRDAEHASAHHGAMLPFPQVLDATMRVQVERQNGDEQEEDSFGERDQRYGPLMSNP